MVDTRVETEVGELSTSHHPADSDRWIFLCHGFGVNKKGSNEGRCEKLAENGWNAVRFSFRGNGESSGDFIEQDLSSRIADLEAVIDHFDPGSCAVFGSSFGGKVAFHAAAQDDRIEAVIARSPVTYNEIMDKFRSVVDEKGEFEYIDGKPIDSRFFEDLDTYRFGDLVGELEAPVLLFQGSDDSSVSQEHTLEAVEKLESDVTLHRFQAEGHRFSDGAEQKMREEMVHWLATVI